RGIAADEVDRVIDLDARARGLRHERDTLRAEVKRLSTEVGAARRWGDVDAAEAMADESRMRGGEERELAGRADKVDDALRQALLVLPNIPSADAPDGAGAEDNVVLRVEGFDPEGYGAPQ